MRHLPRLLREWWDGIHEQIALIAFTSVVMQLSKLAEPVVRARAAELNRRTDQRFGDKANVVQRQTAKMLRIVAEELERA